MIRAVFKGGSIHPVDPLPPDWRDGERLVVDQADGCLPAGELDRWARDVAEAAAAIPSGDFEQLASALADADRQAKESVRRDMGLGS